MQIDETYVGGLGVFLPPTVTVASAVERGLYPAEDADAQGHLAVAVAGDTPAPEMALAAAQEALKRHGAGADNLGLLCYADVWHQGPDGWLPHHYLQRHLTGGAMPAIELRQGCNGMFTAIEIAEVYRRGDPKRRDALIVSADNFGTPLIDRWRTGPNLVVGDAAAAIVLTSTPGFAQLLSVGSVTVPAAEELFRRGEPLFPPGATAGRPLDFAARAKEFIETTPTDDLVAVWLEVGQNLLAVMETGMAEAGIGVDDVTRVAFTHLDRESVEERCLNQLGLPLSRSTWDYGRRIGHLGASDQILALEHLVTSGEVGPGDHVLLAGLGPGVTVSSAVVRIHSAPPWIG